MANAAILPPEMSINVAPSTAGRPAGDSLPTLLEAGAQETPTTSASAAGLSSDDVAMTVVAERLAARTAMQPDDIRLIIPAASEYATRMGDAGASLDGGDVCRICQMGKAVGPLVPLGCACRGDLASTHHPCAQAWFGAAKKTNICELCGQLVNGDFMPSVSDSERVVLHITEDGCITTRVVPADQMPLPRTWRLLGRLNSMRMSQETRALLADRRLPGTLMFAAFVITALLLYLFIKVPTYLVLPIAIAAALIVMAIGQLPATDKLLKQLSKVCHWRFR
eukprot:jgi/Chlat1/6921/Chrsp52S06598